MSDEAQQDQAALLDTKAAAKFLGLQPGTLAGWRCRSFGPRFSRQGRAIRYRKEDLDRWVEERMENP